MYFNTNMFLFLIYFVTILNVYCCKCIDKEYVVYNKTVVVTGAAQGIGYAIADNFLNEGAKFIIILDVKVLRGKQAMQQLNTKYGENKAIFMECDVTKDLKEVFSRIITEFAYIDIFVNNAGILNEYCVKKTIDTIATATIQWSIVVREHMRKDKDGRGGTIINISSIAGYGIQPFAVVYTSAKYAVLGFSKSLGHVYNYNKTGVRVVVLCPGITVTPLLNTAVVWNEQREKFHEFLIGAPRQPADAVGRGAVQVYKQAKTGTAWDIIGGKPPSIAPISKYYSSM